MHKIFRLLSVLIVLLPVCEATRSAHASTITIGETTVLSTADSGNGNLVAAQNATLSQPAIIQSLSFYVTQASGNLVLGIYDASGPNGGPGALKAQTTSFTPVVGWNTANVITSVSLPAGTYWLAYLPSSNSLSFVKGQTSGVSLRYYSYPFGALPATFSTSPSSDPNHWSFYATLNSVSQSISSISLPNVSFIGGSPSGTVVGAINVAMSPSSPAFSGSLSLSTTQGGCTATNGANNSSFAISGGKLVTNGTVPPGTYAVCILATQAGATNSPFGRALTITASSQSTASLSANPTTIITSGHSSTLTWSSTGATSCTGTNFSTGSGSPKSGSATVSPTQTTTYTVAGTNGTNSASASASVTVSGIQTISSIALSNNSTTTGLSSGTAIGMLSVMLSPTTPTFSYIGTNLHFSTSGADSGGVCNSTNGAGNGSFQILNGDTLATNGVLRAGNEAICVAASESGVGANGRAFTITVANRVDAAATYCAANGGGDGSAGSPWQAACIQAAVNAAANGDTVFLAAGNWQLQIANAPVVTGNKSINLVGAGSGNTFDYLGHPSNGSGAPVGTIAPGGSVTRVYTSGASGAGGGYMTFGIYGQNLNTGIFGCANGSPGPSVSHIYVDGAQAQSAGGAFQSTWLEQGDYNGTLNFQSCPNATVNDIRLLAWTGGPVLGVNSPNAQFWKRDSSNFSLLNSVLTLPNQDGQYPGSQVIQFQESNTALLKNNIFYGQTANSIYEDNVTYTGNYTWLGCDAIACTTVLGGFGEAACAGGVWCYANDGMTGSHGYFTTNSYFSMGNNDTSIGGGVNDPTTNGTINDQEFTGNWLFGANAYLSACAWRFPSYHACDPGMLDSSGMQINGEPFTNNSVIGTVSANIDFRGNGCPSAGAHNVGTGSPCAGSTMNEMQCVSCSAMRNYLSAPSDQYLIDSNSVNPSQTNTYCAGGGSFGGCNTTGFNTPPTASFTLSPLSGSVVPFNTATFTAQYGAVKWLASTSSTTPTSSDSRWSFLPPVSLAATHGNRVYMWVMDGANHISSAASQVVP